MDPMEKVSRIDFFKLAIAEALKSIPEDDRSHPKVGAIVVKDDQLMSTGYRGERFLVSGEEHRGHAEFAALQKHPESSLAGSTVYTTLEPCTSRKPGKIPCVQRLCDRRVARVFVGMLDPDPRICGQGVRALREANIDVQLFPATYSSQVEEINRDFIASRNAIRLNLFEPLDDLGIMQVITRASQGDAILIAHIERARVIRIIAVNCDTLLRTVPGPFKKALNQNAEIQILLANPTSQLVAEMEEMELADGREPGSHPIAPGIEQTRADLRSLLREAKKEVLDSSGRILVGHFNTQYRESMIICDDEWVRWTPHLNPARGAERPTFVAMGRNAPFVRLCIRHFEGVKRMCAMISIA